MRWRRANVVASVATLALSCGGDSSSPSSPSTSPGAGPLILSGQVLGTLSGQPVSGARVEVGGVSAVTESSGQFAVSLASAATASVEVTSASHVTRKSFLATTGPNPLIDIIEQDSLWHLDFYRELCRDGSGGGSLRALNPWTVEPRFYVNTSPESGRNRPIPQDAVSTVVEAIHSVVPLLTRGKFQGSQIETGTSPPPDSTSGTVVIRWDPVEVSQVAGPAAAFTRGVGGNASVVVLRTIEDTESIFHELGHVLGLYHPLSGYRPSLMLGFGVPERPYYTQWDIHHTNILYSRPPGNTDIDNDPNGFLLNGASRLSIPQASRVLMICHFQ